MGHLEVGFAFEPDATLEKPELHGIVDFRLGIEVGDRAVLKQALRTPPPVDDEFAVLRIRKDAPYLTVETQGDAQHQRDGNHDGGDAKKNAAPPAAREGGFDPREDALRGDLLPLVVAAGLLPVEVAADVATGPCLARIGGEPLGDRSGLGGGGAVFERLMQKFFRRSVHKNKVCRMKISRTIWPKRLFRSLTPSW